MRYLQTVLCAIGLAAAFGLAVSPTQVLAQAQSAGPTLPPAEYKPLPEGTFVSYDGWGFKVQSSDGFETKIETLDKNFEPEDFLSLYGLFLKKGEWQYTTSSNRPFNSDIDSDDLAALKRFWPLKVGNKISVVITEIHEGSGLPRDWKIDLEVVRTEVVNIRGKRFATYVIAETGTGEYFTDGYGDTPKGTYEANHWYEPGAGIVIKSEFFAATALGRFDKGRLANYELISVRYPAGTTNLALKGTPITGTGLSESDLAAAAERAKRQAEQKYQTQIARLKQEALTATRALQSANLPAGKKATGADLDGVDFGTYHALVIGNQDYEHLPDLKTPVKDAQTVARVLANDYGYTVKTLINATRDDINDALDDYRDALRDTDNLLIYYAGHGWLDEDTQRGYWLPVDAKKDKRSRWLSNATITDTLKGLLAKHVMVVADSCYSGALVRGAAIRVSAAKYWKKMVYKRARVVLTSGGLEPVADKGGGGHSPFAKAFLDALMDNETVMDGTTLFGRMRRPVMVNADQTPEYSDVRNAGHDGGDFLFVKKF